MPFSGMLRGVALVRTDVSEDRTASTIRVTRIGEHSVLRLLLTANVLPNSTITLMLEELRSSETSILRRATKRNIPEDGIFQDQV
jgi:hypothetical protein